jgi:hypothetical protein
LWITDWEVFADCLPPLGKSRIATDSALLRKNYNKWEKSKLDSSMGMIDLIDVTQHYYHNLMHDFGGFVAGKFALSPILKSIVAPRHGLSGSSSTPRQHSSLPHRNLGAARQSPSTCLKPILPSG